MFLSLVLLTSYFVCGAYSGRASTWDSCNCRWLSWYSWSACTATCGGGYRERKRAVRHTDIPECDGFEKCGTPGSGTDTETCNSACHNGGTFHKRSVYKTWCSCPLGTNGRCCENNVTCGRPGSIANGNYEPTRSSYTYNTKVTYSCDHNYIMSSSSSKTRRCTDDGYWAGSSPSCHYFASCTSSPCKNRGYCTNLLDDFRCSCRSGWIGKTCDYDIQPPTVTGCPNDRTIVTSNMTSFQTWTEPQITDPHGFTVVLTKNYQNSQYAFPWGEFTVQYSGVKPSNGLRNECLFKVSVQPHPCPQLKAPTNGMVICNGWRTTYARVCIFHCKENYTLPIGYSDVMFNCGATGNWLPSGIVTECMSKVLYPDRSVRDSKAPVHSFATCSTTTDRNVLADTYITTLKKSALNGLCTNHKSDCVPTNVDIICSV